MVFERIEKGLRGFSIGEKMISIAKTNISLGKIIAEELLKTGFAEIWLDRELNKVGFKSTKNSVSGFKLQQKEGYSGVRITSKLACQFVPYGLYDATKEGDMWVIQVPEIASRNKNG